MKNRLKIKSFILKYESVLSSFVVVLFILILTVKLLLPNFLRITTIFTERKELTTKLVQLKKKEALLTLQNRDVLAEDFARLNMIVPASKDYVLLFSTLDQLQQSTGVFVTRSDFQLGVVSTSSALLKKPVGEPSFLLPINLEVTGDIGQIEIFLRSLTNLSGRMITVNHLQLTMLDDGSVRSSIDGNAYFNPLPKTIGKIDSPLPQIKHEYRQIIERVSQNMVLDRQPPEFPSQVPVGNDNLFF
ncbi:MAG: hypothetical protein UV73_C0002G0113 [Candidatus Gottesmanbacteria bacterium GW2011_GWA2_43_14]|uniref:Uncharacterized protein n=1 Tax=Candidatus Gottesmanbacteria bacterium GW2011_GWA2_43_14 TaxID=1618443 RepID=A0A0G1DL68_9BACT|nr:MAG: hypothetical protein UV73_C0002G0113 [Candidatus Gottesmanbacteria bacterium GW2011_GWA2_43_14]